MSTKENTLKYFLEDTRSHQLTIIRDDGIHRHIELGRPGSSVYRFGLITWPGHLTIYGDCGTMTFRRLPDMFDFFRTENPLGALDIDPHYWSGKSESLNGCARDSCFQWDAEGFKENVSTSFAEWIEEQEFSDDELADEDSDAAQLVAERRESINEILINSDYEHDAMQLLRDMEGCCDVFGEEWYEMRAIRLKYSYLWLCYAIQWGVLKYDLKTMAVSAVTKSINMRGLV